MKKLLLGVFFLLFLYSEPAYSHGYQQNKRQLTDKAQEKKMRKLEKYNKKQQEAFQKRKHKAEIRKGKHRSGVGNSYDNIKKPNKK